MAYKQLPKIVLRGDQERASYRAREGICQLNILKGLMGFQELKQDVRRVRYIDGSEIICRSIFGIDDIEIYVPEVEKGIRRVEPVVLVGVGSYSHPVMSAPAPDVNPYVDYYTYSRRVMLYDVKEDEVIESHMTTTELKERYQIDVWHRDETTYVLTDRGLRLPDDMTHEKSFPLSRYLNKTTGFLDDVYIYSHGAQSHPSVAWTADALVPPADPSYPPPPSSCTGSCYWDQSKYEASNEDLKDVDTKDTNESAVNVYRTSSHILQRDLLLRNVYLDPSAGCPLGTKGFKSIVPGAGRASWICEVSAVGPIDITKENYPRFGGSHRLTTRDTYPSINTGQIGFIQTILKDHQDQLSITPGGVALSGGGPPHPCPYHNGTATFYNRSLDISVSCSFRDWYSISFNHGSYHYYNCPFEGTRGVGGDDFEYPASQQAFLGIEAGIINNKVICATTGIAGSEKMAWPYDGDWAHPGKWDMTAAYKAPKVEKVIAGLNVIPLNRELDDIDMILSANDIDYFSLSTGGKFEDAVQELIDKMYEDTVGDHEKNLLSFICIESRIVEKYIEKVDNVDKIRFRSPIQPNPWISPEIDKPFWRPL